MNTTTDSHLLRVPQKCKCNGSRFLFFQASSKAHHIVVENNNPVVTNVQFDDVEVTIGFCTNCGQVVGDFPITDEQLSINNDE